MRQRSSEGVPRLLQTLARHADLVAEAFAGPVAGGSREREQALQELVHAGALKPYDEGTYYLTGGLHDYFSVSLASFHAMQALTRIDTQLRQAQGQWEELLLLKDAGAVRDRERMEMALERSIIDIADVVERNIRLLNAMVMGQYGNVDSFHSKLRQNRFYAREVDACLRELNKLDSFVELVANAARGAGELRISRLLRRRLSANLLSWSSRLKDAQSVIGSRLFEAQRQERWVRQLARYASWLSGNRTASGWEVDTPPDVDRALVRPVPAAVRRQPDIADPSSGRLDRLVAVAQALKHRPRVAPSAEADPEQSRVLSDTMETVQEQVQAHQQALQELLAHLEESPATLSLRHWKDRYPDLADAPADHWLLYAAVQLQADPSHLAVRFVQDCSAASAGADHRLNTTFQDVEVSLRQKA